MLNSLFLRPVALTAILAFGLTGSLWAQNRDGLPPEPLEKSAAGLDPAGYKAIELTDERVDALRQTLASVGVALRRRDADGLTNLFDCYRMAVECRDRGADKLIPVHQIASFAHGVEQGLGQNLIAKAQFLSFNEFQIRRCLLSDDSTTAIVLAQHSTDPGAVTKYRWWMVRNQGGWRVFDFEELIIPIRATDGMVIVLQAMQQGGPTAMARLQVFNARFLEAGQAMVNGDPYTAESVLAEVDMEELPPVFAATVWAIRASAACGMDAYSQALHFTENAARLRPDMPILELLRASAHNGQRRHAQALAHARACLEVLGDDPDAYYEMAEAYRGLGQSAEAARCYRHSLAENRNAFDALAGLVLVDDGLFTGPGAENQGGGEFLTLLQNMDNVELMFDAICYRLLDQQEYVALGAVVSAYAQSAPLDPNVAYYGAAILQHEGKHAEAAAAILSAIRRVADETEREAFVDLYITAMIEAGSPLAAYQNAPDKEYALEWLAEMFLETETDENIESLEKLLSVHEANLPDDPQLAYYRARRLLQQESYQDAAALLEPLLGTLVGHEEFEFYCSLYWDAMLQAGKPLEAYQRSTDKAAAFEHLISSIVYGGESHENARLFEELIQSHQEHDPDDPNLAYYRAQWLIPQKPLEAAELLLPVIERLHAEKNEEEPYYVDLYLEAMAAAEVPLEGYRRSPDATYAFRTLMGLLDDAGDTDQLERLIELHRESHPADPWIDYCRGLVAQSREDWQQAVEYLLAARDRAAEPEAREAIDSGLTAALFRLGRFERALELRNGDRAAFVDLARLADSPESVDKLARVLELCPDEHRHEPSVAYFTVRLHWRRGEYEAAVDLLKANRRGIEADYSYGYEASSTLVDSLIQLKRFNEAIAAAKEEHSEEHPSLHLAVAYAAAGEVNEMAEILRKYRATYPWYSPYLLYRNSILGPVLRREELTELRRELESAAQLEGAPPSP